MADIARPSTETLDRLYLEWSQFTKARTARELHLEKELYRLRYQIESEAGVPWSDESVARELAKIDSVLAEGENRG